MIGLSSGASIWLACGVTDLRNGFDGLAGLVQTHLAKDAFSGQLLVFRDRRGDRVKMLWWDGDGLCLFAKRLRIPAKSITESGRSRSVSPVMPITESSRSDAGW